MRKYIKNCEKKIFLWNGKLLLLCILQQNIYFIIILFESLIIIEEIKIENDMIKFYSIFIIFCGRKTTLPCFEEYQNVIQLTISKLVRQYFSHKIIKTFTSNLKLIYNRKNTLRRKEST